MQRAGITVGVIFGVIWLVQLVNAADSFGLNNLFGIDPRVVDRLPDIFTAPFLHESWAHIEGNSIPLLILGFLAAYRGLVKFAWVTVSIIVGAGLFVWLTGPTGIETIGASGVITGWLGYVMLRGFFERSGIDLMVGGVAMFIYLGDFNFFPNNAGISWQDHLGGLIVGMACAYLLSDRSPAQVKKRIHDVNAHVQERAEEMHVQERLAKLYDEHFNH
jgi:membrane associated rhomboid family serine protease